MSDTFNRCMRTGFLFAFRRNGEVQTGDLFLTDAGLQIKGVPDGVCGSAPDAIILPCALTRRLYGRREYSDSDPGHVHIIECTDEFRAFVAEWSRPMLDYLPEKVQS